MKLLKRIVGKLACKLYALVHPIKLTKNHPVEKVGNSYCFAFVPLGLINEQSIVYSFGAGLDLHWDVEMIRKFKCKVYLFDPTPKSVKHFQALQQATALNKEFYSEMNAPYKATKAILSQMLFEEVALWNEDTKVKFYEPVNADHVSHSITNIQTSERYIEVEARTLHTIMQSIHHEQLDFLKLDIEGAEFDVLDSIIAMKQMVKVLYVEFHYSKSLSLLQNQKRFYASIQQILNHEYDLIHTYKGRYYTFLSKKGF
jgi:FkbM family methyltransferase